MVRMIHRLAGVWFFVLIAGIAGCASQNEEPAYTKKVDKEKALREYLQLADLYMKEGKRDRALRSINKALDIDSCSSDAYVVLAEYFESDSEVKLAEENYDKAIDCNKKNTTAYYKYGGFLYNQKRYDEACVVLKRASDDHYYEYRSLAFYNYGKCLKKLGDSAGAKEAFRRSVVNDGFPGAMLEWAEMEFEEKNYVKSKQLYDAYVANSKQIPRSLILGIKLMRQFDRKDEESSLAMYLKNNFPYSEQYLEYKKMVGE